MRQTLILLILAVFLAGCAGEGPRQDGLQFYYPREELIYGAEDGVIAPATPEESLQNAPLQQQLAAYLTRPVAAPLRSPFPRDTLLFDLKWEGDDLQLTLSDPFFSLDGLERTLAVASIAKTCFSITQAQSISLLAPDGEVSITMNRATFLFSDDTNAIDMTIGTEAAGN